ncbi:MAG: hypothetical protein Q4B54_06435 [Coriobacteriales bacterium]|nr:hypothetical protein [Coriobacteriales bacterium]
MVKEAFNAGPYQSYWWADEHRSIHPTIKAELSEPVDSRALDQAWMETLRVYPLLDHCVSVVDQEVIFTQREGVNKPISSSARPPLASEAVAFRAASLTYHENAIVLSIYQTLVDALGLVEVFKTLLCLYMRECGHATDDMADAVLQTARLPEDYFVQNTVLELGDYTPVPVMLYRDSLRIFHDDSVAKGGEPPVTSAQLSVPASEFDQLSDRFGATSEVLVAHIVAKSIYALYPEERCDLCMSFGTDFRPTFGLAHTIAPCSKQMPAIISRHDTVLLNTADALKEISRLRDRQLSDDYVKTYVALDNTYGYLQPRNVSCSLSPVGEVGSAGGHVTRVAVYDFSSNTAFLLRLGEQMLISLQYGYATKRYARSIMATLRDLGITVHMVEAPHEVSPESLSIKAAR